jgi:outer membrane protein assembly factor BamB
MTGRQAIGVLLLGVLLAGCASKGIEPSPLPAFKPTADARIAWKASAGDASGFIFSPVGFRGMICAAGGKGRLTCFDGANGRRLWSRQAGVAFSGGVGGGENMILVGTAKGEVLAYATNGTLLWRSRVSSEVLSAPVGSLSTVVVRAGDSKVFGLDARDGRRIWEYQSPPQSLVLRANPGLAIVEDSAVIGGFPGGRLTKLDIRDGSLLWDIPVATPRGDNELERMADIAGTPLVGEGRVCAVAFQGRIGCYEIDKGTQIWARNASSAGSITADSKNVYYTESDSAIAAFDKISGASVWRQEKLLHRRVSAPVVVGEWLLVGDYKGYVHVLSREDGAFVARLATDGSAIVATPLRVEERAVVQTEAGGLYVIDFSHRS